MTMTHTETKPARLMVPGAHGNTYQGWLAAQALYPAAQASDYRHDGIGWCDGAEHTRWSRIRTTPAPQVDTYRHDAHCTGRDDCHCRACE